jgi:hypothetical protein
MSWSIALIVVVNVLYSGVLVSHATHGRWGLVMAFGGYIIANIGLIVVEKTGVG